MGYMLIQTKVYYPNVDTYYDNWIIVTRDLC